MKLRLTLTISYYEPPAINLIIHTLSFGLKTTVGGGGYKIFHTFITIFSLVSGTTFTNIVIDQVMTASMLARILGTFINI